MIIFGSRLYGECDRVDDKYVVATQFVHIWFVPLVPEKSYAVIAKEGRSFRGIAIGFYWRSILLAWGRAACVILALALLISGLMALGAASADAFARLGAAVIPIGFLLLSYKAFARAPPERVTQLTALVERAAEEARERIAAAAAYAQQAQAHQAWGQQAWGQQHGWGPQPGWQPGRPAWGPAVMCSRCGAQAAQGTACQHCGQWC